MRNLFHKSYLKWQHLDTYGYFRVSLFLFSFQWRCEVGCSIISNICNRHEARKYSFFVVLCCCWCCFCSLFHRRKLNLQAQEVCLCVYLDCQEWCECGSVNQSKESNLYSARSFMRDIIFLCKIKHIIRLYYFIIKLRDAKLMMKASEWASEWVSAAAHGIHRNVWVAYAFLHVLW